MSRRRKRKEEKKDFKFVAETESEKRLFIASLVVSEIRQDVYNVLQYTTSAGISHCKLFAKYIAGLHKPNQQTILIPRYVKYLLQYGEFKNYIGFGGKLGQQIIEEMEQVKFMRGGDEGHQKKKNKIFKKISKKFQKNTNI